MRDTSPAAERWYVERLRVRAPHERAATMLALTRAAQTLTRAGIRRRHPRGTTRELDARYAARVYGPAVARRLFPDVTLDER